MKDFTKNEQFQKHLQRRVDVFRKFQPRVKLSHLAQKERSQVSLKRRPFLNVSPLNNPGAFHKLNRQLRKQATHAVTDIQETEYADLRKKFFYLDHTAEVLENYRRL